MKRLLSGNRVIWLLATVAVVFLAAGVILSRFIESPADAAAKVAPPEAGLITVPVENRVIANDVTLRADVLYDQSVDVSLDVSGFSGSPVVTGHIPEVGGTIEAASVVLEVGGRPVIALPGALPAYRSLMVGVSGPDVIQLKQALVALGIDVGNVESDVYDAKTAEAVKALYVKAGYTAPGATEEDLAAVESARESLTSAKSSLADAEAALTTAQNGPTQAERLAADKGVNDAQRALNEAIAARDNPVVDPENPDMGSSAISLQNAVDSAQESYDIAVAQRDEALKGTGTKAQTDARDAARTAVTDAQTAVDTAVAKTMTSLPSSEIVYFSDLPRRVDASSLNRGQILTAGSPFMSVSGTAVIIEGSAAQADAELLSAGLVGNFELPDGTAGTATIAEVKPAEAAAGDDGSEEETSTAGRYTVVFTPDGLTPEQLAAVQGSNIKITIPVNSTSGEVLAVPSAALTAGSGGESRVERKLADGTTELIVVDTGLAADGYVEIVSAEKPLAVDDKVVVGK